MHGGASPQARAAAERRREQRAVVLAAEKFGLSRKVDPHTALLEELHRTAGAVQWLGAVVAGIDDGAINQAAPNPYVELWQKERRHLVDVARECIKSGIEERRVRLAESAGQQLASVVRAVLDRMLAALVDAVGAERATELALEAVWAQSALVIVPEEFRRVAEDDS